MRLASTVTDTPGHRDLQKRDHGTSKTDDADLIAVAAGECERGVSTNGQTLGHALLASTLGVTHLVAGHNDRSH